METGSKDSVFWKGEKSYSYEIEVENEFTNIKNKKIIAKTFFIG